MKLYNTRTRNIEELKPLDEKNVRMYSCGPTVYDHAHIGNLGAYIFADTLRRVLASAGYNVTHAMNYTDVDDKTIRRSAEKYENLEPKAALKKLADEYIKLFLDDMKKIGNDVGSLTFLRATDSNVIVGMKKLIKEIYDGGFAYVSEDGVYFSIDAYRKSGKKYGQLLELTMANTSEARIQNDEYDKESVHDFALWKKQKGNEPAWEFKLDGHDMKGRPGWHIECSVMSRQALGQPFDIHTGGVDLIFPHHENEIAQSTACENDPVMANFFVHNEHILVDGKKMAKSANNFYTLQDIIDRGFDPLAFRLLVLQAHYRSQAHFSWENLEAAQNRLREYQATAALRWQTEDTVTSEPDFRFSQFDNKLNELIGDDIDTPSVLAFLSNAAAQLLDTNVSTEFKDEFIGMLQSVDNLLGLNLSAIPDISDDQKRFIADREKAREAKDWAKADEIRDILEQQGVGLRDTPNGTVWYRTN